MFVFRRFSPARSNSSARNNSLQQQHQTNAEFHQNLAEENHQTHFLLHSSRSNSDSHQYV